MSNKYVPIGIASKMLGVSIMTLRRWEKSGKLVPERTPTNHRRYLMSDIQTFNPLNINRQILKKATIGYARVSSYATQKKDLDRQVKVLEMYMASQGWKYTIIKDLGSGMNYNKKGLKQLLDDILNNKIGRLVLTHKDRLLRFGAELIFSICEIKNVEIILINNGDEVKSYEQELAEDVLEIITVFSARLYGARSHKNKKLVDGMKKAVNDVN
jgi:predicted site-specific integrase-resolvase